MGAEEDLTLVGSVVRRTWKYKGQRRKARHWSVRYRDETNRWHEHLTDPPTSDKKAAGDQLKIIEADILRGTFRPRSARETIGGVLDAYERARRARDDHRFQRNDAFVLERIREAVPANLLAASFDADRARDVVAKMFGSGGAASTRRYPIVMLKAAFNLAVDEGRLPFNPIARMKNPMPSVRRTVTWSREEFEAVVRELPEWCRRAACVGALTLLRLGDVLRLERRMVRSGHLHPHIEKGDHAGGPRPIGRELAACLPPGQGRFFFSPASAGDRPYTLAGFRSRWIAALEKAGLTKERWFHDLRRTGAEILVRANFPDLVVDDALDHARSDVLSRYPKVRQEQRDEAFRVIAEWWAPSIRRIRRPRTIRKQ